MANPLEEKHERKRVLLSGPGEPYPEPPDIDGYEIIGPLGAGGMGVVWRAKQLGTHREVALKVLDQGILKSGPRARIRFEREVTIAARLEHLNIARVYESGIHKNHYFYVMELVHGEALNQYVQHHKLSTQEILHLMHKVCQAVQYAHQNGIIHRDLKHSNIMVTPDGQPKVLDFGLARDLLADDRDRKVSLDGDVMGTPEFMSPEQAAGDIDAVDTRSDVYSLGVILYDLLINRLPYDMTGLHYNDLKTIQEQEPARPSSIVPRFEKDLEAILLKALAKEPDERYQSAAELARDVQFWLEGLPVIAQPVTTFYLLRKFIARHRTISIIVGLLLIIIVSTLFISLYSYNQMRGLFRDSRFREQTYLREAIRERTFRQQVTLDLFLERWHSGNLARAGETLIFFDPDSREGLAVRFFLDRRPFDVKEAHYQNKLAAEQPSFWWFVVGEYNLKNGNRPAAIEAYRQCLDAEEESSELDDWYINRAKGRLNELSASDA